MTHEKDEPMASTLIHEAQLDEALKRITVIERELASLGRLLVSNNKTHRARLDRLEQQAEDNIETGDILVEMATSIQAQQSVIETLQNQMADLGTDDERRDIKQSLNDLWDSHRALQARVKQLAADGLLTDKAIRVLNNGAWPMRPEDDPHR